MTLYHVNVPQYDDVLNNKSKSLTCHKFQVTEHRSDFQSLRYN